MKRPCTCDRIRLGEPYAAGQCRLCWLYHHDAAYNREWGGNGNVVPARHILPAGNNTPEMLADLEAKHPEVQVVRIPALPPRGPVNLAPTWFQKLVVRPFRFARAAVAHAWAGLPETPTEEQQRRIAICLDCPDDMLDRVNGTCKKCLCNVAAKAAWNEQRCPLGHW